jgi:hypothetical protein
MGKLNSMNKEIPKKEEEDRIAMGNFLNSILGLKPR